MMYKMILSFEKCVSSRKVVMYSGNTEIIDLNIKLLKAPEITMER